MRLVLLAEGFEGREPPVAWDDVPLALRELPDGSVFALALSAALALDPEEVLLVAREVPEAWRLALRELPGGGRVRVVTPLRGSLVRTLANRALGDGATLFLDARVALRTADLEGALASSGPVIRLTTRRGDAAWVWRGPPGRGDHARAPAHLVRPVAAARSLDELLGTALSASRGVWIAPGASVATGALAEATDVVIGAGAVVEPGAKLVGRVLIGPGCRIRAGAEVRDAAIFDADVGAVALSDALACGDRLWSRSQRFALRVEDPAWLAPARQALGPTTPLPDRALAGLALLALAPALALVALAVRAGSPGPALYRSERRVDPGSAVDDPDGYALVAPKTVPHRVFRTMRDGADRMRVAAANLYGAGPFRKYEGDERVTRVGGALRRTSVDELPLLAGVLAGELSLVGLWPLPTAEAEAMARGPFAVGDRDLTATARRRFRGPPGLAGLWQASGRSKVSAAARAVHDAYQAAVYAAGPERALLDGDYARYATPAGRAWLVARTVGRVLTREGAI